MQKEGAWGLQWKGSGEDWEWRRFSGVGDGAESDNYDPKSLHNESKHVGQYELPSKHQFEDMDDARLVQKSESTVPGCFLLWIIIGAIMQQRHIRPGQFLIVLMMGASNRSCQPDIDGVGHTNQSISRILRISIDIAYYTLILTRLVVGFSLCLLHVFRASVISIVIIALAPLFKQTHVLHKPIARR